MAGKATKQVIVDAIIKEIEKGSTRGAVVSKFCKKFQKSDRTIDTYWKIANEQYSIRQQKAKEAADKVYIQSSADAAKEAVMSSIERKEVLSKIARGNFPLKKPMVINGKLRLVPVVPDWTERRNAIAELNKMEGDYAPTKIASTDKEGNDVKPLNDAELDKMLLKIEQLLPK